MKDSKTKVEESFTEVGIICRVAFRGPMHLRTYVSEEGGDGEAVRSETSSLLSYTLRDVSFVEVGIICRVALREPMNLCTCVSEEGGDGEAARSETPSLLPYTLGDVSFAEVGICRVKKKKSTLPKTFFFLSDRRSEIMEKLQELKGFEHEYKLHANGRWVILRRRWVLVKHIMLMHVHLSRCVFRSCFMFKVRRCNLTTFSMQESQSFGNSFI
jgi:hypothetical protein